MTEIVKAETGSIVFTDEQKLRAGTLRQQIQTELEEVNKQETLLKRGYVRLGCWLSETKQNEYWRLWGFGSFGKFMTDLRERYEKGRTQLFHYTSVVEKLLPQISEADLETMGISKAIVLKNTVTRTRGTIDDETVATACDPRTTEQGLKAFVHTRYDLPPGEKPKGTWFDFGGFFLDADEREEIRRAMGVAEKVDPPIAADLPDWARRKEILLRFAREFLGTYEAAVSRGEG